METDPFPAILGRIFRGVPAYTQSTQLGTLIFECPKNKNVLNCENAIKTCLTRVRSLYT